MTDRENRPDLRAPLLSEELARELLQLECREAGGQREWALAHCFSPAYVNDAIHGRRAIGPGLADAIGLERVMYYRQKRQITPLPPRRTSAICAACRPQEGER